MRALSPGRTTSPLFATIVLLSLTTASLLAAEPAREPAPPPPSSPSQSSPSQSSPPQSSPPQSSPPPHTPPDSPAEAVVRDVCDQQVVVLAELPTHGEVKAHTTKAEIARALVERCGFDAVLFEAGVYDFVGFERALEAHGATPRQLDRAIGGFWASEELAPFRGWLFERTTAGTLTVGGLDDQPSATADYAKATLPGLVASNVAEDDPENDSETCRDAVHRHLHWQYDDAHPFDEDEMARLVACTGQASKQASDRWSKMSRSQPRTEDLVMLEAIETYLARQQPSAASGPVAKDRDEVMADTAFWYRERLTQTRLTQTLERAPRLVIWTSTVHASRGPNHRTERSLGARFEEALGADRVALVGFTAFAGTSSTAGMPAKTLEPMPDGSLEARATVGPTGPATPWAHLDHDALRSLGQVPSRLLGRPGGHHVTADWSTHFDAVVVFREDTAPSGRAPGATR